MTTPENPERLWACVLGRGGPPMICADFEREDVLCDRQGWESSDDYSKITEYVRADIAAAREAVLVAERDALRARVERLRTGIEDALATHELTANGPAQTVIEDVQGALDEDEKAALSGKGVG